MKAILFVISILLVTNVFAQKNYLSISNADRETETVFKQNKRVRVRTIHGGKLSGRLQILNQEEVMIKNVVIPISNIKKIKNNPLAMNLLISGSMVFVGGYGVLLSVLAFSFGARLGGAVILAAGGGTLVAAILSPNILPATHVYKNSAVKVVMMQ